MPQCPQHGATMANKKTTSPSSTARVAVIGAGIAGLACARTLAQAGCEVTVFEKSRGFGGRMACRQTPFGTHDHGAQYFTVRDKRFDAALGIAPGLCTPWNANGVRVLDPLGRVGLLGTIPIASAVIAALVIAWVSGRRGLVVSAAILATFLASGISEDLIDWRYAGVQFVPFLLAGLLGSTWIRRRSARPME